MSKQEFLEGLRRSLSGGLEAQKINEHIHYYSDYIDTQIRMGKREEDVMASLGDPRLIAKTLLGVADAETVTEEFVDEDKEEDRTGREYWVRGKRIRLPEWLVTILVCIGCFMILTVVFALVTRLVPLFFMLMLGIFLYRSIKNLF